MNKKLNEQISDIKYEINELIRGVSEDGRTGSDVCRELKYINELLDELIQENEQKKQKKRLNKAITLMRTHCIYNDCDKCQFGYYCNGLNVLPCDWKNIE